MPLLCDRPRSSQVDFETARFIVAKGCGLVVGEQHLELGDEVPQGVLSGHVLRQIYEPPLRLIETIAYGMQIDPLREACARRGVEFVPGAAATPPAPLPPSPASPTPAAPPAKKMKFRMDWLSTRTQKQLVYICSQHNVDANGSKQELRDRLAALVA